MSSAPGADPRLAEVQVVHLAHLPNEALGQGLQEGALSIATFCKRVDGAPLTHICRIGKVFPVIAEVGVQDEMVE